MTLFGIVTLAAILFGVYHHYERRKIESEREKFASNMVDVVKACDWYSRYRKPLRRAVSTSKSGVKSSWRIHLRPYVGDVGSMVRWYDPSVPWNTPSNLMGVGYVDVYSYTGERTEDQLTNVVTLTGPGTVLDPETDINTDDVPVDTILFIEVKDSGIHWLEPKDMHIDELHNSTGVAKTLSNFPGGFHVAFFDREVWFLDEDIPRELVATFCTIEGSRRLDRDEVLGPYRLK
jgi:hypothetical protein